MSPPVLIVWFWGIFAFVLTDFLELTSDDLTFFVVFVLVFVVLPVFVFLFWFFDLSGLGIEDSDWSEFFTSHACTLEVCIWVWCALSDVIGDPELVPFWYWILLFCWCLLSRAWGRIFPDPLLTVIVCCFAWRVLLILGDLFCCLELISLLGVFWCWLIPFFLFLDLFVFFVLVWICCVFFFSCLWLILCCLVVYIRVLISVWFTAVDLVVLLFAWFVWWWFASLLISCALWLTLLCSDDLMLLMIYVIVWLFWFHALMYDLCVCGLVGMTDAFWSLSLTCLIYICVMTLMSLNFSVLASSWLMIFLVFDTAWCLGSESFHLFPCYFIPYVWWCDADIWLIYDVIDLAGWGGFFLPVI